MTFSVGWDANSKRSVSLVFSMILSRFGDESIEAGRNCRSSTIWSYSSVVRELARSARGYRARGPGFEFRSGHVMFPPL